MYIYIYISYKTLRYFFLADGVEARPPSSTQDREISISNWAATTLSKRCLGSWWSPAIRCIAEVCSDPVWNFIELPVLGSNHRDSLSPISLRSLYRSPYRSLSLYLYTPWHGGDGTKPPPKPLWIAEYTDYETISMRMITVRRRTAFGHGDQYHRDAMGPSSLYFSVKTIPG